MILLHVAPLDFGRPNGISVSVPALAAAQQALPEVDVALLSTSQAEIEAASTESALPVFDHRRANGIASLPAPFNDPDLVVFHNTYVRPHAALGREVARRGIPYIITPRGGLTTDAQRVRRAKKALGNLLFLRRFVGRAAAIHCLTPREAALSGGWRRPIFVVGNGAVTPPDDEVASPGAKPLVRFTFVGRLDPHHKGLDRLLDACGLIADELRRHGARVEMWGSDHRGGRQMVQHMIESHRLSEVVSLRGPVRGQGKRAVLLESDVFVHTSRFEGHPLAVLEALAHGLPCMLTAGTNVAAEVAGGGAGWEVGDEPEAIAAAMLSIIERKDDLASMGGAARRLVRARYTWPVVARQTIDRYLQVRSGTLDSDHRPPAAGPTA